LHNDGGEDPDGGEMTAPDLMPDVVLTVEMLAGSTAIANAWPSAIEVVPVAETVIVLVFALLIVDAVQPSHIEKTGVITAPEPLVAVAKPFRSKAIVTGNVNESPTMRVTPLLNVKARDSLVSMLPF